MIGYFSHDSNARNDEKLLRLRMKNGAAGYGVYFMLLERLRDEADYTSVKDYNVIAFDLRVDASLIKDVVENFGLFAFTDDGKCFYSESLNERMSLMDAAKSKKAAAGKKGAAKRWNSKDIAQPSKNDSSAITVPSQTDSSAIAQPTKNDGNKTKVNKTNKTKVTDSQTGGVSRTQSLKAWQTLWGSPNTFALQDLHDWCRDFGDDLVTYVIQYAARRNVSSKAAYSYVDRTLTSYKNAGITTVEQAEADAERHRERVAAEQSQRNAKKPRYGKPPVIENKPSWEQEGHKEPNLQLSTDQQDKLNAALASLRKPKEDAND